MEYVFAFTVIAGLLVLFAAVQATQDERMHESAILKTLGATPQSIGKVFTLAGMGIGLAGVTIGCTFGFLLCWVRYWP